jgi:hypothetical protein
MKKRRRKKKKKKLDEKKLHLNKFVTSEMENTIIQFIE